jgi:hypothetical protein
MTLRVLADLQRLLNHEEDWEGKDVAMELLAREIVKLTDSQYSEFLGYLHQGTMMVSAMKKSEAEAYVAAIDAKNEITREKIIRENFT